MDPFLGYISDLSKALGKEKHDLSQLRPDLVAVGIDLSGGKVRIKITPIEVKCRPTSRFGAPEAVDALDQAKALSALFSAMKRSEGQPKLWALAYQHLLLSIIGFGLRVYSQHHDVLTTLKVPEAELPDPHHFHDIKGHRRTALRLKWWQSGALTWRDAALSVPDPETLPATPIEGDVAFRAYWAEAKPVFFGHYKRLGTPTIDAPNAVCLDYPRVTCAYRWAGEATLDPQNLVVLD